MVHKSYYCHVWWLLFSKANLVKSKTILWHSWFALQWRYNEREGFSNHQAYYYLLNRLFSHRSKETSKLRVTGLCEGNSPVTSEFPTQSASNTETASIWWRHHGYERFYPYTSEFSIDFIRAPKPSKDLEVCYSELIIWIKKKLIIYQNRSQQICVHVLSNIPHIMSALSLLEDSNYNGN